MPRWDTPLARALLGAALLLTAAGCSQPVAANEVTYVGTDFAFEGPDTIPAGLTTVAIDNQGAEAHQVVMIRIEDGKTVDEALAEAAESDNGLPQSVVFEGGPVAAMPGQMVATTMVLEPGNYVIVCEIPSADGVTHTKKGMVMPVTVTEDGAGAGSLPEADASVGLEEYAFVAPDFAPGTQTIRLENDGEEVHEALLIKLDEGKTAMDFAAAFEPGAPPGPPPGSVVGGVGGIDPGKSAQFEATFEPGQYAWICFYPAPDKTPHMVKGMVKEFTVEE